jgi:hypothetical protein
LQSSLIFPLSSVVEPVAAVKHRSKTNVFEFVAGRRRIGADEAELETEIFRGDTSGTPIDETMNAMGARSLR